MHRLYLVFEDCADVGEPTVPEEAAEEGHVLLHRSAVVSAASANGAIARCAIEALFPIKGESRLVAVPLGGFTARHVGEDTKPRPCILKDMDKSYH